MKKLRVIVHLIQINGKYWFLLYVLERITKKFTSFFYNKRIRHETKNQLAGFNSVEYNYKEWSNYDWSKEGEEWTTSGNWKEALVKEVIDVYINPEGVILEIGPGAGRWSAILAPRSKHLILVDLTESSIEICREKLKLYPQCTFYKNNGRDLSFIKDSSIDYLWSFDVFVHIAPSDIEYYIKACSRIFKYGAVGLIHHSTQGTESEGFRSSLTNDLFLDILSKYNLKVINQIDHDGNDTHFKLSKNDVITVFCKASKEN